VKAESAKITVKEGWQFSAPLVGRDPATDIAVLQIQGASNSRRLHSAIVVGDFVIAVSRCLRRPVEIFNAYSRPPASSHVNARGICCIKWLPISAAHTKPICCYSRITPFRFNLQKKVAEARSQKNDWLRRVKFAVWKIEALATRNQLICEVYESSAGTVLIGQ
jgi:hypothetical protein